MSNTKIARLKLTRDRLVMQRLAAEITAVKARLARLEKRYAKQEQEAETVHAGSGAQPGLCEEGGDPAVGGDGIQRSGQGTGEVTTDTQAPIAA